MNKISLQKIIQSPIIKIVVGILIVAGVVALVEYFRQLILDKSSLTNESKDIIVAVIQIPLALISYIFLFKFLEKRKIEELSASSFLRNAIGGILIGFLFQSLIIFLLYIFGNYKILQINPVSFILPALIASLVAGFVAEILIRGIFFRIIEQKLGTVIALMISALLFAVPHAISKGASLLSVVSTTLEAGILVSAIYVYSRSLWFPIFLHFAWDFTGPGIFGVINPGIRVEKSLFSSVVTGPTVWTGAELGPDNSLQSALFCLITSIFFLALAKRRGNFIDPYWKKQPRLYRTSI